jgi:hypothetical protein
LSGTQAKARIIEIGWINSPGLWVAKQWRPKLLLMIRMEVWVGGRWALAGTCHETLNLVLVGRLGLLARLVAVQDVAVVQPRLIHAGKGAAAEVDGVAVRHGVLHRSKARCLLTGWSSPVLWLQRRLLTISWMS